MEPPQIRVDPESCKRCGFCASVCPSHVFRWEKGEVPSIEGVDLCCVCGHCVAVCAGGAITHSLLDPSAFKKLDETAPIATNRLVDFVWSRRSVRAYKKRDVPRELLERAAQAAGFAPTGSFGHEGRVRQVVIVSGAETMGEIAAITARYMEKLRDVLDSFVVKTVARFSDEARAGRMTLPDIAMRLARWEAGENAITYDAPAAIFVHTAQGTTTPHEDVDAALMNILLTCHALGLGTCWNGWLAHAATGAHVKHFTALQEFLGLPDTDRIVQAATIGWPRLPLHDLPERKTEIRWVDAPSGSD